MQSNQKQPPIRHFILSKTVSLKLQRLNYVFYNLEVVTKWFSYVYLSTNSLICLQTVAGQDHLCSCLVMADR